MRKLKRAGQKLARKISESKSAIVAGASVIGATASQAAVTYTEGAGFSGSLDMTSYTTAIPIVVTVIAVVIATTIGIKALKGAKSA